MNKQPLIVNVLLVISLTLNIAYISYKFHGERKREKKQAQTEKPCPCHE